jgi:hypothetical protein
MLHYLSVPQGINASWQWFHHQQLFVIFICIYSTIMYRTHVQYQETAAEKMKFPKRQLLC